MASNLVERAAQSVERQQDPTRATIKDQIRAMESQFALAMPRGMEAAQLVRDAITAIGTTPKLAECDPQSVLGSLMTCAQLGLRPGVLGHAWVLPYWDTKARGFKAQLIIGYEGLVELAHRTGQVASLIAREVYANDHFDIDYGLADNLIHKPALHGDRGEVIGYYAIVKYRGGGHSFIYATRSDIERHRDRYAPRNKEKQIVGPWRDHFDAMAKKSVVRDLARWMPKSTEFASAISADEGVRVDLSPTADIAQATEPSVIDAAVEPAAIEPPREVTSGEWGDLMDANAQPQEAENA